MRVLMGILLAGFAAVSWASPGAAPVSGYGAGVLAYECRHVEPEGFTCALDATHTGAELKLHWVDLGEVSQARTEYFTYRFNLIVTRYLELGGAYYQITADVWPDGSGQLCAPLNRRRLESTCWVSRD